MEEDGAASRYPPPPQNNKFFPTLMPQRVKNQITRGGEGAVWGSRFGLRVHVWGFSLGSLGCWVLCQVGGLLVGVVVEKNVHAEREAADHEHEHDEKLRKVHKQHTVH